MAIDLKNTTANNLLDNFDTLFPSGAILDISTGAVAGAENTDTGTKLASVVLPASPWGAAAAGSKAKSGTWSVAAIAAGTAGHYRLRNVGDTHRIEGTVTATGGGGDCTLDNTNIAVNQTVTVNTFSYSL